MLSRYHLHLVIASMSSNKSEYFDSFKYDIDGTCNLQVFLEVGLVAIRPIALLLVEKRYRLKCVCTIESVLSSILLRQCDVFNTEYNSVSPKFTRNSMILIFITRCKNERIILHWGKYQPTAKNLTRI